jgi:alpha-L-rhamnosidase
VIASVLGSGHFDDATRTWDWGWEKAQWRGVPRLRLDLHVTYADGSETLVRSDDGWKVSVDGPTRYDSYYLGETYDARREIAGWDRRDSTTRAGRRRVVQAPAGTLRAQVQEPIRVVDSGPPGTRSEPSPGVFVYDIGQNLTGWAAIRVNAPAGTAIEVFYSEKARADGAPARPATTSSSGSCRPTTTSRRARGDESFTPRFNYKGFQYVQLSGPRGEPLPAGASVSVERIEQVRTGLASTGSFESSSETLNHIHRNTAWAVQNNMHGIITDTPVYEKNAWTGDAALTAGTAVAALRHRAPLQEDVPGHARRPDGGGGAVAPCAQQPELRLRRQARVQARGVLRRDAGLGRVLVRDPLGERTAPRRPRRARGELPAMRKYLDEWIPRWTGKDGDAYGQTLTSGLGDWVPPEGVPTINALVSSAYYARMRGSLPTSRAPSARRTTPTLREAVRRHQGDFNARFLGKDGVYREKEAEPFVETAQILPLAFGLVPDELRAPVAARLADDIVKARGGHAYVGVIGARYVLPVLTETGHHDVAVAVATQTSEPSWGYWTEKAGFTALGEHWPATTRSRNHHFFGAIVEWLYEDLARHPAGFARLRGDRVQAQIPASGLDRVSASYDSVRGTIASSWQRTPTGLEAGRQRARGCDGQGLRSGAERAGRERGRRGPGDRSRERRRRALRRRGRLAASSTSRLRPLPVPRRERPRGREAEGAAHALVAAPGGARQ